MINSDDIFLKNITNDINEDQGLVARGCDWQLDGSQSSDPDHMFHHFHHNDDDDDDDDGDYDDDDDDDAEDINGDDDDKDDINDDERKVRGGMGRIYGQVQSMASPEYCNVS